jgi:hypothetical protein
MSDFKQPNGKYLPEGIYMEATALSWTEGRAGTYHSYLVYRDGAGNAEVIRGGADPLGNGNMDLELEIGKSLSASSDAYTNKNIQYFDQRTHLYAKMDIGDRDAKTVWEEMKTNAKSIDTTINYNPKIGNVAKSVANLALDGQVALAKNSVVCHSVVGTVLTSSGIPITDAIAKMNEANKSSKAINEDSFTGIKTDLFGDGLIKEVFLDKVLKPVQQANEIKKDVEKTVEDAKEKVEEKAKETIEDVKEKINEAETKLEKVIDDINKVLETTQKVVETAQKVVDVVKATLPLLKGISEIFKELKKSAPSTEKTTDKTADNTVSDASDAKSAKTLPFEYLVKSEVGVETLTLAAAQQPWERLNISQKDYESLAKPDNDKQHVSDSINHTATA